MNHRLLLAGLCAILLAPVGCGGEESDEAADSGAGGGGDVSCEPGETTDCVCPDGGFSERGCAQSGTEFLECQCGATTGTSSGTGTGTGGDKACGDGTCSADEDCGSCSDDCGICEPCTAASACIGDYSSPPAGSVAVPDLDIPKLERVSREAMLARLTTALQAGDAGTRVLVAALSSTRPSLEHPLTGAIRSTLESQPAARQALVRQLTNAGMESPDDYRAQFPEVRLDHEVLQSVPPTYSPSDGADVAACGEAKLRLAVSMITVHEEDDDFTNDIVYCALQAAGQAGSEVRVTPKTPNLDEGESHQFPIEKTTFWGQRGPTAALGDLTVVYDCIESDTNNGYDQLIDGIANAAEEYGDTEDLGDDGWVSDNAGTIATVVNIAIALDSDDPLFSATQTISADMQLALTNGGTWSVRREGTHLGSDWDWELTVNSWGCAENGAK